MKLTMNNIDIKFIINDLSKYKSFRLINVYELDSKTIEETKLSVYNLLRPIEQDKKFFVRKFVNLSESTRSYLKNINTHGAYVKLRQERGVLRMNGESLTGLSLVKFLENYSERRFEYVNDIKRIIETNNFMKFDKVEGLIN